MRLESFYLVWLEVFIMKLKTLVNFSFQLFCFPGLYTYSGLLYAIYGMVGHFKSPFLVYKPNHGREAEKGLHLYLGLQAVWQSNIYETDDTFLFYIMILKFVNIWFRKNIMGNYYIWLFLSWIYKIQQQQNLIPKIFQLTFVWASKYYGFMRFKLFDQRSNSHELNFYRS